VGGAHDAGARAEPVMGQGPTKSVGGKEKIFLIKFSFLFEGELLQTITEESAQDASDNSKERTKR